MMGRVVRYISFLVAVVPLISSCLFENDLSYPIVPGLITEFAVEGQKSVEIDAGRREVKVLLGETADIADVKIEKFTVSDEAEVDGGIPGSLDLTSPVQFTLKTYQKYVWTISAEQPIARYIEVDNQAGETEFNLREKIAIVYVTAGQKLSKVRFNAMKLEPEGSEILSTTGKTSVDFTLVEETLDCRFPMTLDCVLDRTFDVRLSDGENVRWTVKVIQKVVNEEITSVNPRCYHALVRATFNGHGNPAIEYRKASSDVWERAESTVSGVGISADITGLDPETEYVVRVVSGDEASAEYPFATETPAQLSNMSFDDWWNANEGGTKSLWYPYAENASEKVWDSANKATSSFIGSSTMPEDVIKVKGRAVRMESKNAVIAFAAGNIYTGKFNRIYGMGADLDWGVPFTSRPYSLKGWYNYTPATIDKVKAPYEDMLGSTDRCQVQVFLTDWDAPFNVNTAEGKLVDFEKDAHIIAYGKLETDEYTGGWKEFEVKLDYRDTQRIPKYVVITCCASYLGDYFTGGIGSLLYIDEFEFVYE
ncbi:MAG: PCMD domain-containing protein [Clostridium sp.]|nr:PCMD domain-containing protein [Bacteroides sp.]MCM1198773.1 PCMD domain-containing protein [Clostridium sp.]